MAVANIFHGKTASLTMGNAGTAGLTREIFDYRLSEEVEFAEGTLHSDEATGTRTWIPAFRTWSLGFMLFVHDDGEMSSDNIHALMLGINNNGFGCEIHLDDSHYWAGDVYLQSWTIQNNANGVPMMTCTALGNGDIQTGGWS